MQPRLLQGKTALVTGAGRGLGRAFADLVARLGADVAVHGMREDGPAEYGEGTVAGVSGTGPRSVATVTFDGPAGTRRFVLAHGAIEPA